MTSFYHWQRCSPNREHALTILDDPQPRSDAIASRPFASKYLQMASRPSQVEELERPLAEQFERACARMGLDEGHTRLELEFTDGRLVLLYTHRLRRTRASLAEYNHHDEEPDRAAE